MREISAAKITDTVAELYIKANLELTPDIPRVLSAFLQKESNPLARKLLEALQENLEAARNLDIPICQDTGLAIVLIELGQEVHITGGGMENAINEGISKACREGYLRASIVSDPLRRVNTGDNTPAVIHTSVVEGGKMKITVAPKGFGSENMSRLKMFTPAADREDIINYVVWAVKAAGSNPCPPVVVGVGVGGNAEKACLMAKESFICRKLGSVHPVPFYAEMEAETLERINALGIGPQGLGGDTTALAVHYTAAPTHIAGLPVAVNISCHVLRHQTIEI